MKKTYVLSLILFLAIMGLAMILTGCVACFFDIGSLVMVLISAIIMILANYSIADIGKYFALGYRKEAVMPSELKDGILFFKSFQKYLAIAGGIGFFMGLIAMLATLDDPEKIGRGLALALITVLYAMFFSMIITVPFRTGLERKLNELDA